MSERVVVKRDGGIADVRLSRPDKLNALDPAMFEALVVTGRELAADRSLRAVVLSGEGRAFSAGLDFGSFQAMGEGERATRSLAERAQDEIANHAQQTGWIWHELPVPVIAAVHGVAFGGGLQIALGADLRLVAPDARLSIFEIHWGLVPDMSGTQTLRHLMRLDVLKELAFTGREVDGHEAVKLGLATRVSENPYGEALEMARTVAQKSPTAMRALKKLLNASRRVEAAEGLALEERLQLELIGSPNQVEAVRARLEKREPRFVEPD